MLSASACPRDQRGLGKLILPASCFHTFPPGTVGRLPPSTHYSFILQIDSGRSSWGSVLTPLGVRCCHSALLTLTWNESPGQVNVAIGPGVPLPRALSISRMAPWVKSQFRLRQLLPGGRFCSWLQHSSPGTVVEQGELSVESSALSPGAAWGREGQQQALPGLCPPPWHSPPRLPPARTEEGTGVPAPTKSLPRLQLDRDTSHSTDDKLLFVLRVTLCVGEMNQGFSTLFLLCTNRPRMASPPPPHPTPPPPPHTPSPSGRKPQAEVP